MKDYKQDAPFAVQIELAEGCNLRCTFCGLSGIREPKKHDFKFMTEKTLRSLLRQIGELGWNPRVEFAMHGEPTMHPDYVGMIKVARESAPRLQLMMTSNAGGLMRKPGPLANVLALFDAGLNVLALDDYDGVNFVDKVRQAVRATSERGPEMLGDMKIYEYPENKDGSPHMRVGLKERKLVYIQAIDSAVKGNHSLLNNHAGAGAPKVGSDHPSQTQRCAKPFRELSVRWDGSVAVCCNDWRGEYKCGSVVKDGLDAVWNGASMSAARRKLYHGQRDFGPCAGCDAISYRVGLLPDKFGKVKLPKPDASTIKTIAAVLRGPSLTAPVLREWER